MVRGGLVTGHRWILSVENGSALFLLTSLLVSPEEGKKKGKKERSRTCFESSQPGRELSVELCKADEAEWLSGLPYAR